MRQLAPPRCPSCRSWLPRESTFCARCGASVAGAGTDIVLDGEANLSRAPLAAPGPEETAPSSTRRGWSILAALVGAVVLVGFLPDLLERSADDAPGTSVPTVVEPSGPVPSSAPTVTSEPPLTLAPPTEPVEDVGPIVVPAEPVDVPEGLRGRRLQVGDEVRGLVAELVLDEELVLTVQMAPVPVSGTVRVWPEATAVRLADGWLLLGASPARPPVEAPDLVRGTDTIWAWQPDGGGGELTPVLGPGESLPEPWNIPAGMQPVAVSDAGVLVWTPYGAELHLLGAAADHRLLARGELVAGSPTGVLLRQCTFEACRLVEVSADGAVRPVLDLDGSPLDLETTFRSAGAFAPDGSRVVLPSTSGSRDVVLVDLRTASVTYRAAQSWDMIRGLVDGHVVWDPSGRYVIVPGGDSLGVLDTDTSQWWELAVAMPAGAGLDIVVPLP